MQKWDYMYVTREYDDKNQLWTLTYPQDGEWKTWPDGVPAFLSAAGDAGWELISQQMTTWTHPVATGGGSGWSGTHTAYLYAEKLIFKRPKEPDVESSTSVPPGMAADKLT